jgi:hypothetical protein
VDFIINLDAQVFSRRSPRHPQAGERHSHTQGPCKKVCEFFSRSSFHLNPVSGLFLGDKRVISSSELFLSPSIPFGIIVENPVLEIAGLDFDSGLKMGSSGISGFGTIESG